MKKKWLDLDNEGIGFNVNPVFEGENGHLMMELQKSYGGDSRFKLDERFKDDIEIRKMPFSVGVDKTEQFQQLSELQNEQQRQLDILSEIVPSVQRFRQVNNTGNRLIKRFDPRKPDQNLVIQNTNISQKQHKEENSVKQDLKLPQKRQRQKKEFEDTLIKKKEMRKKAPRRKVRQEVKIKSLEPVSNFSLFS